MPTINASTANEIEIRSYEPAMRKDWDLFVDKSESATFFHRAAWPEVIENVYGHKNQSLIAVRREEIVGVLPLTHVKSALFGSSFASTAFTVGGGALATKLDVANALADEAVRRATDQGVDHVEMKSVSTTFGDWATKSDLYASFRKEYPDDEDENLKMIPRKKRADVRKSLKSDLRVDAHATSGAFYKLYSESVRNLGTPVFPKRLIDALKAAFEDAMEISVTEGPAGPLAGLVSFYFKDEVLPYYGGAVPAARASHAYDYQYWSLMRRAKARGSRIFDFGRSKYGTGAFDYKKYWGFEPTALHYQYKLIKGAQIPDINPLNPKYKLLVAAWRRLPLPVANVIGPLVARELG